MRRVETSKLREYLIKKKEELCERLPDKPFIYVEDILGSSLPTRDKFTILLNELWMSEDELLLFKLNCASHALNLTNEQIRSGEYGIEHQAKMLESIIGGD